MKKVIYPIAIGVLIALSAGCFNPKAYDDVKPDGKINLLGSDGMSVADGSSSFEVKAKISSEASAGRRTVTFQTNLGSFKGGKGDSIDVEAIDFVSAAKLTSVKEGTAKVTVKIKGVQAIENRTVTFTKAFPEKISVEVDSFSVKNNFRSEATITATLSTNNNGIPSTGHPVVFTVSDNSGNPVGFFLNNISDSSTDSQGKVKIRYSAGTSPYTGFLTIKASTKSSETEIIFSTTQIFLEK
jgi:hypothetical protein